MPNARELMAALGGRVGVPVTDSQAAAHAIRFDGHVVNLVADDDRDELRCLVRVCPVPADPGARLALYGRLLKANACGLGTGGGQLGVDGGEASVILHWGAPAADLDADRLESIVAALLDLAEALQRDVVPDPAGEPSAGRAPPPAGGLRA